MRRIKIEMNKHIYIFDLNEVLLDRYPAKISKALIQKYGVKNYHFIFIYCEDYRGDKPKMLPKNSKVYFLPGLGRRSIHTLVQKYPPSCFVTIGLRLPDMLLLTIFNKLNIPTFMIQHGLFVDHLQRVSLHKLAIIKFKKLLKYLLYSKQIAQEINQSYPIVLRELFKYFIAGSHNLPQLQKINTNKFISEYGLIFNRSWNKYYIDTYGYSLNQFSYIGNPDYELIKGHSHQNEEKTIMYICQTLVEDGRYSKSNYLEFLQKFKTTFKDEKIYLKLHPRSDRNLYKIFEDIDNVEIGDEYKNSDVVLGHYSSLLKIASDFGKHVIVFELKGHEVPDYYRQLVDRTYEKPTDALQAIHTYRKLGRRSNINKELRLYLDHKHSSYEIAATKIAEVISTKTYE